MAPHRRTLSSLATTCGYGAWHLADGASRPGRSRPACRRT